MSARAGGSATSSGSGAATEREPTHSQQQHRRHAVAAAARAERSTGKPQRFNHHRPRALTLEHRERRVEAPLARAQEALQRGVVVAVWRELWRQAQPRGAHHALELLKHGVVVRQARGLELLRTRRTEGGGDEGQGVGVVCSGGGGDRRRACCSAQQRRRATRSVDLDHRQASATHIVCNPRHAIHSPGCAWHAVAALLFQGTPAARQGARSKLRSTAHCDGDGHVHLLLLRPPARCWETCSSSIKPPCIYINVSCDPSYRYLMVMYDAWWRRRSSHLLSRQLSAFFACHQHKQECPREHSQCVHQTTPIDR